MVMWMSMVNLMTEGLSRQVMHHLELAESLALAGNHAESAVHLEAARNTFLAVGLIRGNVNKLGSLKGEETIQIIIDPLTGQPLPGPFIDGIESNPAQAWNAAEIRVHTILEELVERAAKVEASILAVPRLEPRGFYPSIESLWQAARNGDPAIKAEVRRWTERTLKNGRIVSSSGRRSELRTNADALVQESAPRADDSELRTDANASVPKSARIVDQSEPRTDADALVQESARIAGRSELSSSALPEADAAAKRIEPAALLLAPRAELRARVSESAKEEGARFIVSIGKGKPAALKEIRAALESAIDSVLREYTPQESGSLIDENYGLYLRIIEHKKGRLLNLMKKLAAGPSDAGDKKVSIGLSIPDAEEELGHTAAGDYAAFFRQYFLGKIDRLILTGKEGSSLAAPLREDGFLVHTERKIRKVLLLSGQKKFPLLVSGMDLPEAADDSVEPIGIHLAPEVRRETAALARLAQIVYGFAYAMSAESEGEHDAVREQIVRALLLDHDFEAAAGGIILSNKDGHFYIDAAALELQAALEIQRALDISA